MTKFSKPQIVELLNTKQPSRPFSPLVAVAVLEGSKKIDLNNPDIMDLSEFSLVFGFCFDKNWPRKRQKMLEHATQWKGHPSITAKTLAFTSLL